MRSLVWLLAVACITACGADRATGASVTSRSMGRNPASTIVTADGPLFFLDGQRLAPGTRLELLPRDIESIEVLKGAAAASQYGDDGRRGVILIRTIKR